MNYKIDRKLRISSFIILFLFVSLFLLFNFSTVRAESVTQRTEIPVDESLADQTLNEYSPPNSVAVVRVRPPESLQYAESEEWLRGFYYYSIVKMGFRDIPFNYVVTWDGEIYQGKGGHYDVMPLAEWNTDNDRRSVVVAYFDNNKEVGVDSKKSLTDIVSEVLTKYDIEKEQTFAADLSIAEKSEVESVIKLTQLETGYWKEVVSEITESARVGNDSRDLEGEFISAEYPESVDAGSNFVVTVKMKNTGEFPWYNQGGKATYISTYDPLGHDTTLSVGDKWASLSLAVNPNEDWVLPGEEGTFEFEIDTPLVPGDHSESFVLVELPDNVVEGTQFDMNFNVNKGDYDLVEILDTETGYLNVRKCPSTGCENVGKVVPGEVYIMTGRDGNWYKINYSEDSEGWVYAKYAKAL